MPLLRKSFAALRSHEWWGYKLPPLLAVGYAVVLRSGQELYAQAGRLLFLLAALAVGAVYVSLVNDLTDREEDRNSGKHNRMDALLSWQRNGLLVLSLAGGALCFYFLRGDRWSTVFYAAGWVAFTLYSVPPFRLKKRGGWGVLADAGGAHLFPSLLFLSAMSHGLAVPLEPLWWGPVAVWSFGYGLRGILWHQFSDREQDRAVGLKTFATSRELERFRSLALVLLVVELAALSFFLWWLGQVLTVVFLGGYVFLLVLYRRLPGMEFLVVLPAPRPPYHILMSSYYQLFLPLALLLSDAAAHPRSWILLLLQLLLFPGHIRRLARDVAKALAVRPVSHR